MTDATTKFFEALEARGHNPMLEKAKGTVRFDLRDGKRTARWVVSIDKGDVAVSRRSAKADCVVRMDKSLFDEITTGRANPMTALMRGEIQAEGDMGLLTTFQRAFPGPPRRKS
jgi:putative sterol carrier protein